MGTLLKIIGGGVLFGIGKGIGCFLWEEVGEPIAEIGWEIMFGD